MINYDEVHLASRHIWVGALDVSCSNIKGRVDKGVRAYLIIEQVCICLHSFLFIRTIL